MQWLSDMFVAFSQWLIGLVTAIFQVIKLVVIDVICFVLEKLGELLVSITSVFDLTPVAQWTNTMWANVPAEILQFATSIGLQESLGIIGGAVMIRLALQLVPFTRLGS